MNMMDHMIMSPEIRGCDPKFHSFLEHSQRRPDICDRISTKSFFSGVSKLFARSRGTKTGASSRKLVAFTGVTSTWLACGAAHNGRAGRADLGAPAGWAGPLGEVQLHAHLAPKRFVISVAGPCGTRAARHLRSTGSHPHLGRTSESRRSRHFAAKRLGGEGGVYTMRQRS